MRELLLVKVGIKESLTAMKRISFLMMALSVSVAFADNENYDGQDVSGQNFDGASLVDSSWIGSIAKDASFGKANLANANFNNADLTKAYFSEATLAGANFEGSTINGAVLNGITSLGFTKEQFYSTASYRSGDLSGIYLWENDLSGWDFGGKNLTTVSFGNAVLADANFKNATVAGANFHGTISKGFTREQLYSTASYKSGDLRRINFSYEDVSGWDFEGQNLIGANFFYSDLTNTNFENAVINLVHFNAINGAGLTKEQLYSTASYKNKDLRGVKLSGIDLSGWDFSGQNLMHAWLWDGGSNIRDVNFTKADLRGSDLTVARYNIITKNTIMYDGTIRDFSMKSSDDSFSIRKHELPSPYDSITPINAKIDISKSVSGGAKLTLEAGAKLDIIRDSMLEFDNGGELLICVSKDDSTEISVESGSGLAFLEGSTLTVDVSGDFDGMDSFTFRIIGWEDGSNMIGLDDFVMDENLFLTLNGADFDGDWFYEISDNGLLITIAVPEPALFAAIFGILSLCLAQWRRRQ